MLLNRGGEEFQRESTWKGGSLNYPRLRSGDHGVRGPVLLNVEIVLFSHCHFSDLPGGPMPASPLEVPFCNLVSCSVELRQDSLVRGVRYTECSTNHEVKRWLSREALRGQLGNCGEGLGCWQVVDQVGEESIQSI